MLSIDEKLMLARYAEDTHILTSGITLPNAKNQLILNIENPK